VIPEPVSSPRRLVADELDVVADDTYLYRLSRSVRSFRRGCGVASQGSGSGFAGGTILVECNNATDHLLSINHIGLTAIKVTTVH
jgi:hypothetical protein